MVDGRAWLDQVRVTPASLDVHLGGSAIAGARVELNSATYRCDARATETGQDPGQPAHMPARQR